MAGNVRCAVLKALTHVGAGRGLSADDLKQRFSVQRFAEDVVHTHGSTIDHDLFGLVGGEGGDPGL